jgi:hypothetical protein
LICDSRGERGIESRELNDLFIKKEHSIKDYVKVAIFARILVSL